MNPYDWSTRASTRHSVRVIMDENGLTWVQKTLLCAVIHGESDFDIYAKHINMGKNGEVLSTDFGICQINDFYHIGPGKEFASEQEIYNDPRKSVQFMIDMWRHGKLGWWCAFSNKSYIQYLVVESLPSK